MLTAKEVAAEIAGVKPGLQALRQILELIASYEHDVDAGSILLEIARLELKNALRKREPYPCQALVTGEILPALDEPGIGSSGLVKRPRR